MVKNNHLMLLTAVNKKSANLGGFFIEPWVCDSILPILSGCPF
jgi:hypothetical protein